MQIRTLTMSGSGKVVKTKLFIGNLDPGTQAGLNAIQDLCHSNRFFSIFLEELTELFSPFGPVLEASVIKDYGFVVREECPLDFAFMSIYIFIIA